MKDKLLDFSRRTGCRIDIFDCIQSTNDKIKDSIYTGGDIVIAESQSAGRGQAGNSWNSEAGANLTFSMLLEPSFLRADKQFYISKIITLALCDTLSQFGVMAKVKWPNDIYIGDKKIAGILIENDLLGSTIQRSIAGIGLNVNQTCFPETLPNPVSMVNICGVITDRADVLIHFYINLDRYYSLLAEGRFATIDNDYLVSLFRLGELYTYAEPQGEKFKGKITTVKPSGELQIERMDGTVKHYLFKEVEYIL